MGTWGGATIINEVVASVVAEWNGLEERAVHKGWDVVAMESMSNILAAGVPNKVTSNCWIASASRSSAKLHMWFARQIFCNAWGEQRKAVMKEEMVINKRISGGMLGDGKREISGYTSVINSATLSSLKGRFIPASIISLT